MEDCVKRFSEFEFLLEMDGDGSHQIDDILRMIDSRDESAVLVGSRYLRESKITGWPASRRAFSKILNLIIPKMLSLNVTDVTNGLRLYPKSAVRKLLHTKAKTDSFVYLSEALLHLSDTKYMQREELEQLVAPSRMVALRPLIFETGIQ